MLHAQLNAYSVTLVLQLILATLWRFFFVLWLLGSEDQQHDQCFWRFAALSQLPGGAGSPRPAGNLDVQAYNLGVPLLELQKFWVFFEIWNHFGIPEESAFFPTKELGPWQEAGLGGFTCQRLSDLVTDWPTVTDRDCRWRCPCCRCFCGLPCCNWSWLTLRARWDKMKLRGRNFPTVFGQV